MAITSVEEVVAGLYIALEQNFLPADEFNKFYEQCHMIVAKINALVKRLSSAEDGRR